MKQNTMKQSADIKVISFDLDDALYDNRPVIQNAENICRAYLAQQFAEQGRPFDFDEFYAIKQKLLQQNNPELENMNVFRQTALQEFCQVLCNAEPIVDRAFELFINARSLATIDPAIATLLHQLAEEFQLVTVTNGNCDPRKLSVGHLFTQHYSPLDGYRAKPHPEMLQIILKRFELQPTQLLHVGDSLQHDGLAAQAAGVRFVHFAPFTEGASITSSVSQLVEALGFVEG
jgi:FMN hydrolase / 5-amino-6-(5-phospho-D-ribitylamino)uracil phosphatase